MAADVEEKPIVPHGAADAADIEGIALEDEHVAPFLR